MEQYSETPDGLQIFNLLIFLPILIESSVRNQGYKDCQGLLAIVLTVITIWLAQLNFDAYDRLDGAQKENLLYHLEYRRDQLTAQLKQNRIDSVTFLASYNKALNQQTKIKWASKLTTLKFETKRNKTQMVYLLDRISDLESMIDK